MLQTVRRSFTKQFSFCYLLNHAVNFFSDLGLFKSVVTFSLYAHSEVLQEIPIKVSEVFCHRELFYVLTFNSNSSNILTASVLGGILSYQVVVVVFDIYQPRHRLLFISHHSEYVVVFVTVKLVHCPQSKLVETPFLDDSSSR